MYVPIHPEVNKTRIRTLLLKSSPVIILNFLPKSVVPKNFIIMKETPKMNITSKRSNMTDIFLFTIGGVSNYWEPTFDS